jgi:hypothetical protein
MTDRNRRVAIILAVLFCGGGLVCLVCGVFGFFRLQEWGQQVQRDAQATIAEADDFARTHDQVGCRDEGLRRADLCGLTDVNCNAQVTVFTDRCMAAATPTPGFCDGVPAQTEIMESARWAAAQCQQMGRAQDTHCTTLLQSVQRACARQ